MKKLGGILALFMVGVWVVTLGVPAIMAEGPGVGGGHYGLMETGALSGGVVVDDATLCWGDDDDYCYKHYSSGQWDLIATDVDGGGGTDGVVSRIVDGTDDVAWTGRLFGAGSSPLYLGKAGTSGESLNADGVYMGDKCEIDGVLYADNGIEIPSAKWFNIGSNNDFRMIYSTGQVPNMNMMALGSNSLGLVVVDLGGSGTNYAHANPTNATIWIQSGDETSIADYLGLSHDQEDASFEAGTGDFKFKFGDDAKGSLAYVEMNYEDLDFGAGAASKTTSGLVPDGAWLKAIVGRVTEADTGACTAIDIGDGSDVDLFGNDVAVTLGTTFTPAGATADWSNPQWDGGTEVTLTGVGGDCDDLIVRVVAYFDTFAAPTSN